MKFLSVSHGKIRSSQHTAVGVRLPVAGIGMILPTLPPNLFPVHVLLGFGSIALIFC